MRPKQSTLNSVCTLLKTAIKIVGPKRSMMMAAHLAEDMAPVAFQQTRFGVIKFLCLGKIPVYRARTLHTKEPETLQWIETFRDGETFWDIGANVGLYSLYAAFKGHAVLAFEPSPNNYHLLCRNIEINQKSKSLSAYCIAFADRTKLGSLHMASSQIGAAMHSFGEVDGLQHGSSSALWSQATLGFCIDDFIQLFDPPFPSHIKIDVDGIEGKIISGARKTINDRRLKSVLVELDRKEKTQCNGILNVFKSASFEFVNESGFHRPNNRRGFDVYNGIFVRPT